MKQYSTYDIQRSSQYLSELPVEIIKRGEVVARIVPASFDIGGDIKELKRQLDLYKARVEELEKTKESLGVPMEPKVESPLISKEEKLKALREMIKTPSIEARNEYHKCQWKFGCVKEAVEEVEDAEFDGVKAVKFKKFYCKAHMAKARQNIDKFEAEGAFI